MKRTTILKLSSIALLSLLIACGGEEKNETPTEAPKSMVEESPATTGGGLEAQMASGKAVYEKTCQACHQADGKGLPATFPPLAGSDYLAADLPRAIAGVTNGLTGEITVNGEKFNQTMPAAAHTDEEIAAAFTYVLNSFGNKGGEVSAAEVKAVRK
jgi:mono/diheme cytochrome c family protein